MSSRIDPYDCLRHAGGAGPLVRDIANATARHYGVSYADLVGSRRSQLPTFARHVAFYIARFRTTRSLPEIGRQFSGRDHTTVLSGVRKIERLLRHSPDLRSDIAAIEAELRVQPETSALVTSEAETLALALRDAVASARQAADEIERLVIRTEAALGEIKEARGQPNAAGLLDVARTLAAAHDKMIFASFDADQKERAATAFNRAVVALKQAVAPAQGPNPTAEKGTEHGLRH